MKRNETDIQKLVEELQSQNKKKKDFVVPASCLSMREGKIIVSNRNLSPDLAKILIGTGLTKKGAEIELKPLEVCNEQLSEKLEIPKKYFDRMMNGNLDLLDQNVSYWFNKGSKSFFLRTFVDKEEQKGEARALLSDRFNTIDNYDVMLACLEAIKDSGIPLKIESCDITERKLYMRFVSPEIELQAPELLKHYNVPDDRLRGGKTGIMSGFIITNSEVGQSQFSISPRVVISACSNGMIFKDDAFSKVHLGSQMQQYSEINWSEDTKRKNYELIISQVQDSIKTFISEDYLGRKVRQFEELGGQKLEHPTDCVRNVSNFLKLSEEKEKSILDFFIKGGDSSAFGVAQAITFLAHEVESADEQFDIESGTGDMMHSIKRFDHEFKPLKAKYKKPLLASY